MSECRRPPMRAWRRSAALHPELPDVGAAAHLGTHRARAASRMANRCSDVRWRDTWRRQHRFDPLDRAAQIEIAHCSIRFRNTIRHDRAEFPMADGWDPRSPDSPLARLTPRATSSPARRVPPGCRRHDLPSSHTGRCRPRIAEAGEEGGCFYGRNTQQLTWPQSPKTTRPSSNRTGGPRHAEGDLPRVWPPGLAVRVVHAALGLCCVTAVSSPAKGGTLTLSSWAFSRSRGRSASSVGTGATARGRGG